MKRIRQRPVRSGGSGRMMWVVQLGDVGPAGQGWGRTLTKSINIGVHVKGGGQASQVYAICQVIAKAAVTYYAKYFDPFSALELKKTLVVYDC